MNVALVVLGVLLVLFGVFKIGYSVYYLKHHHDTNTFADDCLELFILVFGVYSIVHGLAHVFHDSKYGQIVNDTNSVALVFLVFGVFMVELYLFIVYAKIEFLRNPDKISQYKVLGIGGGITFLMTVIAKILWDKHFGIAIDPLWDFGYVALYLAMLVLLGVLIFIVVDGIRAEKKKAEKDGMTEAKIAMLLVSILLNQ